MFCLGGKTSKDKYVASILATIYTCSCIPDSLLLLVFLMGTFCIFVHFCLMHAFFNFPGPPNFGLSKQYLQDSQFEEVHPVHSPHLVLL